MLQTLTDFYRRFCICSVKSSICAAIMTFMTPFFNERSGLLFVHELSDN